MLKNHHQPNNTEEKILKPYIKLAMLFDIFNAAISERAYSQSESINAFFNNPRNRNLPYIYYLKKFFDKNIKN